MGCFFYAVNLHHRTRRKRVKRRTVGQSHFRIVRRAPRVRPRIIPERTFVMSKTSSTSTARVINNNEKGWNRNTDCCVDVKTFLRSDRLTRIGKTYQGLLRLDHQYHYTFIETKGTKTQRRNPRIYEGRYLTVTCQADGTFRPNLRKVPVGSGFNIDDYAIAVCNELRAALTGLVEESE